MTIDKSDLINKQKRQIISLKRNLRAKIQKDVTNALAGKLGEENNGMVQSNVISQLRHVHRANQQMRRQMNEMKASFRQVEADSAMYRDALNRNERENSRYIKQEFKPEPTYTFQNIESDVLTRLTGSTSSLIYQVKTCRDNNFLLHENLDYRTGETYEVVVGGWSNTESAIIKGIQGPRKDVIKLAGLVSCTEFRPFWLSWANDIITVGKGNILGKNELLRWRPDPPMEFNFVSYSSFINNQGIWKFLVQ